jgi:hypothetical protein
LPVELRSKSVEHDLKLPVGLRPNSGRTPVELRSKSVEHDLKLPVELRSNFGRSRSKSVELGELSRFRTLQASPFEPPGARSV